MAVNIAKIAARTRIVQLSCSCWRATHYHHGASAEINARHGTGNKAHAIIRVCDHEALKKLQQLHAQARAFNASPEMSYPTVTEGMRILRICKEFEHSAKMQEFAVEHARLLAWFLRDYETERRNAPNSLNTLYDPKMWPSQSQMERKFGFHCRYLECPTTGAWADWLAGSVVAARMELKDTIMEAVQHMADRCKAKNRLYDSVFTGLRDLVLAVPDLDDDGELREMCNRLMPLANLDPDTVREDPALKADVAKKADDILSVFGGGGILAGV